MDIKKYFKKEKNTVYFIGDKLELFIPERYDIHGVLDVNESITTMGIFDMKLNGTDIGYCLPAMITIEPTEIDIVTIEDAKYVKAVLYKNDIFIKSLEIVKNPQLAYVIFYEFLFSGKAPKFLTYDDYALIFNEVSKMTNTNFGVSHTIFEIITSQLFRDKNDVNKLYRLTNMKDKPIQLPLRDVSYASKSTTSRLIGSYFDNSLTAALVNPNNEESLIENIYRM